MKTSLLFLSLILLSTASCGQISVEEEAGREMIRNKYSFRPLSNTTMPEELKEQLYIPFYKDGQYYFSNYEGEIIDDQAWEAIRFVGNKPFFWGKKETSWSLYSFPSQLLVDKVFTNKEARRIVVDLEREHARGKLWSIELDTTLFELRKAQGANVPNAEVQDYSHDDVEVTVKKKFYFSTNSEQAATRGYIEPGQYALEKLPSYRKRQYSKGFDMPYLKALDTEFNYCLIDINGKQVFEKCYYDIQSLNERFVALINQEGKMALANVESGVVFDFLFDNIKAVSSCGNTFLAVKGQSGAEQQLFQLESNGQYSEIEDEDDISCEESPSENKPPARNNEAEVIAFKKDGKYGIKKADGSTLLEPSLKQHPSIYPDIGWILIKEKPTYGILNFDGEWLFPLEHRKVFRGGSSGSHEYTFELYDSGYRCIFNENMELILENPYIFLPISTYDLSSIEEDIRPEPQELKRPLLFQEYYVLSDGEYGHIFTATGKYISSHRGQYDENTALLGLPREEQYKYVFVPIGKFSDNGIEYYVRLKDGFEYRE